MFCPFHVDSNHWILIVAYPRLKILHSYDSLNGSRGVALRLFKGMFEKVLGKKFQWRAEVLKSRKQDNSEDCGVYVCMHVAALCIGLRETEWPSVDQCRMIITMALVSGKLPLLTSPKVCILWHINLCITIMLLTALLRCPETHVLYP